ncbi:MAG: single-stranded DNA-binding protein [Lentisphaeria bacterium]
MASLNKVLLMGNLTRDPELKYTQGGTAICKLGLAVNRRYQTSQGEDREETCFVDIDAFGRQAELCDRYLRKGAPAFVEGRLRLDQWEDRNTGQSRSKLKVNAQRVQFLGSPGSGSTFEDNQPPQSQSREQQSQQQPPQQQSAPPPPAPEPQSETDDSGIDDQIPF